MSFHACCSLLNIVAICACTSVIGSSLSSTSRLSTCTISGRLDAYANVGAKLKSYKARVSFTNVYYYDSHLQCITYHEVFYFY